MAEPHAPEAAPPVLPPVDDEPDEHLDLPGAMTLIEHLEELRSRLIKIVLAVAAASVLGFFLSEPIIEILRRPLPDEGTSLIQTTLGESLAVRLRIALFAGVAVAMPVILYQVWRFVTPGLLPHERRLLWPMLGAAIVLFAGGMTIGYLVVPLAIQFLLGLAVEGVTPMLRLSEYVSFVTTLLIAFGLALQFPVVLLLVARIGLLNYRFLAARRRWAILVIVLFAILITPGGDPFSSSLLSIIMYALFEGTLQIIRVTRGG